MSDTRRCMKIVTPRSFHRSINKVILRVYYKSSKLLTCLFINTSLFRIDRNSIKSLEGDEVFSKQVRLSRDNLWLKIRCVHGSCDYDNV